MHQDKLFNWFEQRPKWLIEVVNRLSNNRKFEERDIIECTKLCKEEAAGKELKVNLAISKDFFRDIDNKKIHLLSISDVKGINALSPKKPLNFGDGNLTIIYGDNGSGKSGYVRILKKMCGARASEDVFPNIYLNENTSQECKVSYKIADNKKQVIWRVNEGVINDLRSIDIYDSSCGHVYISKENEVTYEPFILVFFSELIKISEKISENLKNEKEILVSALPTLPSDFKDTVSGKWYLSLSHETSQKEINEHCKWENTNEKELNEIQQRLAEKDPSEKAKQVRKQQKYTEELLDELKRDFKNLSDDTCKRIIELKNTAINKKKTAELAAKKVFENAPLEGIGTDIWKQLWEIARKYSEQQAYTDKTFPYVGENSRCVLCQQPLSEDTKTLMLSFEEYVKGQTQKEADIAREKYEYAMNEIPEIPSSTGLITKIDSAGLDDDLKNYLIDCYAALRERKEKLVNANKIEELPSLPNCDEIINKINEKIKVYDESAKKYEDDASNDNRDELNRKLRKFLAKKWLAQQKEHIYKEIERLKQIKILDEAIKLTNTKALSQKKGELANILITETFVSRFNEELQQLGASRIKIKLVKSKVAKGKVLHKLELKSDIKQDIPLNRVLSEGEYRIVSLAAFLADVGRKEFTSPFIFDDPISSLDQNFEEAVVHRLVNLSKEKQVIIFTHRLSLLSLTPEYAKKEGIDTHIVCIRQESWGTGEPGDTPIFAKKPHKALNSLLNERLQKAKKIFSEIGKEEYYPIAKSICSDFRIILERMIEEVLLADVVQRFRRAITTMGKIDKLAKIKNEDCKFFDDFMTKYSRYEHSQPQESPVYSPEPDELETDIKKLQKWYEDFTKRGK